MSDIDYGSRWTQLVNSPDGQDIEQRLGNVLADWEADPNAYDLEIDFAERSTVSAYDAGDDICLILWFDAEGAAEHLIDVWTSYNECDEDTRAHQFAADELDRVLHILMHALQEHWEKRYAEEDDE